MSGRVEIRYQGVWGSICDDNFDDIDAGVICRQLNMTYVIQILFCVIVYCHD